MKKYYISSFIILCAFFILPGPGFAGVASSKHDLSAVSGGAGGFYSTNEQEICIFCHTPHSAIVNDKEDGSGNRVPLWNRLLNQSVASYAMYESASMKHTKPDAPIGVSLLCMSCHDGVSAMNVLVNYSPSNPSINMYFGYDQLSDIYHTGFPGYPGANIGEMEGASVAGQRTLSNDHPISFSYDSTLVGLSGGALNDPTWVEDNSALKLFDYGAINDVLECATCHDPHEQGLNETYPFLRMGNDGSQMCLMCHNK